MEKEKLFLEAVAATNSIALGIRPELTDEKVREEVRDRIYKAQAAWEAWERNVLDSKELTVQDLLDYMTNKVVNKQIPVEIVECIGECSFRVHNCMVMKEGDAEAEYFLIIGNNEPA